MADGELRSLLPRVLERRPTPLDLPPAVARRPLGTEPAASHSPAIVEVDVQDHRNLRKLPQQLPSPLDDIATLVRSLTYGEMIELCEAMWKIRSEGDLTEEKLPALLHRWSISRLAAAARHVNDGATTRGFNQRLDRAG